MAFTKSLITLACAAAALAANGAEVKIGGMVDTGLRFQHTSTGTGTSTNTLEMAEGMLNANRIIFMGGENLRPDTDLGFCLEASYASDSGEMKTEGSLFDRGSYIYIKDQDLGQVAFGRLGIMRSGATPLSFDITGARINPFGTGWGNLASPMYVMPFYGFPSSNMVQYDTPSFAGVKGHFQYSFDADTKGNNVVEGSSSADRYASAAFTWDSSVANLVFMADWMNEASTSGDQEDALGLLFGGNVKLDPVKLYAFGTWFKGGDMIMPLPGLSDCRPLTGLDDIGGHAFSVGLRAPLLSGEFDLYAMRRSADADDADVPQQPEPQHRLGFQVFRVNKHLVPPKRNRCRRSQQRFARCISYSSAVPVSSASACRMQSRKKAFCLMPFRLRYALSCSNSSVGT